MATDRVRVLFATSEMTPFSKTGGLADVSAALPAALAQAGCHVRVVTPRYAAVDRARFGIERSSVECDFVFNVRGRAIKAGFSRWESPQTGLEVLFVECDPFYDRPGIYSDPFTGADYADNDYRYSLLPRAAFELCRVMEWKPDIFHCNDWQTALIPFLLSQTPLAEQFADARSVLTIHNIAYHGSFSPDAVEAIENASAYLYPDGPFDHQGQVNFLKAGIEFADAVNTVSPTYAREIQTSSEYGYGMETSLRARGDAVVGILNGIDVRAWNPATDSQIAAIYTAETLDRKKRNKEALCRQCNLPFEETTPLIGMISRLTSQKGFEILIPVLSEILELPCRMVILGSGDSFLSQTLREIARQHPSRISVHLGYDDELAHRIEAGADIFLMPSKYEPCGLNQMMSMRYGTLPVVRATGGLADTVTDADADPERGTGFSFHQYHPHDLLHAVRRAAAAFADGDRWRRIQRTAMTRDFSWNRSAEQYIDLYQSCLQRSGRAAPLPA